MHLGATGSLCSLRVGKGGGKKERASILLEGIYRTGEFRNRRLKAKGPASSSRYPFPRAPHGENRTNRILSPRFLFLTAFSSEHKATFQRRLTNYPQLPEGESFLDAFLPPVSLHLTCCKNEPSQVPGRHCLSRLHALQLLGAKPSECAVLDRLVHGHRSPLLAE